MPTSALSSVVDMEHYPAASLSKWSLPFHCGPQLLSAGQTGGGNVCVANQSHSGDFNSATQQRLVHACQDRRNVNRKS
ncbi:uncharacterized [Tachysurus ichikawai]